MTPEVRLIGNHASLAPAFGIAASCIFSVIALAQNNPGPLPKGNSNEELLHIVNGGKDEWLVEEEAKIKTHLPDGFWDMSSKDAARALLAVNSDSKIKQKFQFAIAEGDGTPPSRGEVGIRWTCVHCVTAMNGSMVLRYREQDSQLQYSVVDSFDRQEARRARNQPRFVAVAQKEARQLYEVVWWLGKVKAVPIKSEQSDSSEATAESAFTTADSEALFWVLPVRSVRKTWLPVLELSEQLVGDFELRTWASCAAFLLTDALDRQGVNLNQPTIALPPDPERERLKKFESETKPDPRSTDKTKKWVTRLVALLSDPKQPIRYDRIVPALVPDADPLRYSDPRIDSALFKFVSSAMNAPERDDKCLRLDGGMAARALALRGRPELFPLLMRAIRDSNVKDTIWKERAFEAAVVLAERQTQFRDEIVAVLKEQLKQPTGTDFDAIWRLNLREFKPELESGATASPDEIEVRRSDANAPRRSHRARAVLAAWNEQDPLTKLKLNALIGASSNYMIRAPEFVRVDYEELPPDQQKSFREFLAWMDVQRIQYGMWRPEEVKCLIPE